MIQMLAMTASMLLVGWIVWKAINRREEGDETLQARLEEDDRRAAMEEARIGRDGNGD